MAAPDGLAAVPACAGALPIVPSSARRWCNPVPLLASPLPCPRPPAPPQAAQFTTSRRDELLELQRTVLGFDDIAAREGLRPSEAEIEVRPGLVAAGPGQAQPLGGPVLLGGGVALGALVGEGAPRHPPKPAPAAAAALRPTAAAAPPLLAAFRAKQALHAPPTRRRLDPSVAQAEFKTAAADFAKYSQEFDAARLREQVGPVGGGGLQLPGGRVAALQRCAVRCLSACRYVSRPRHTTLRHAPLPLPSCLVLAAPPGR